jgi:hypothetical protein
MKTAETKSASHQPNNTAAKSFFNQGQEQTFFSENSSDRTSFFPSTASDQVQFKPIAGGRSFFSPASVALQAKCAACEAEEQAAAKESMAEPPTLQRTPAFESEGAIQAKVAPKTDAIALPTPSQTPPNSDTKELEQPEEAIAGTPEIQMMPAFSSAEDTGDGEDGNAEQPPVQFSLKVGQPGDAYEREADAMADRVVSMPRVMSSDVTPKTIGAPQPQQVNRKQTMGMRSLMQQPADGSPAPAPKNLESRLQSQGSGAPLDTNTRSEMEGAFDADFSGVQVHTGQEAATLNQSLGARAFTHGNKIFFNSGEYQPQSQSGKHLLAHELTHTLQQGASVQRKPAVSPTSHEVQMLPSIISSELAKYARNIPGYTLLTVVIGFNPLTGNPVVRNATNLLEGLMGLVPFGTFIFDKLREHGILQSAFKWVEGELTRLDLSLARIERTIEEAWEDVRLIEGFDYNLEVLKRHFGKLYNDVKSFALSLVNHVIELIKKAVISQVEKLLADNKAWALIKKILHYDPLKGEAVEATIEEILEDFLRLIGKEQELEQMREKGTLKETAAWIKTQIGTFLSLLSELKGLFTAAWDAIQPQNLPNLATNLRNLVTQATGFLKRVWTFAVTVAVKVLELIKKVLLGWLSQHAAKTPGYFLLTVVLGKDIFSQQVVTRSVANIIKGFITLLPNGEQQYKQMEETGVIARAAGRIEALMSQLGITWAFVRDLFLGIWNKLSIESLIQPIATFIQIVSLFKEPILRLLKFTIEVIKIVLDLVLQLMNFPPGIVGRIINNAMQAFEDIKKNPVGFLLNLLKAVKTGFLKFFDNILKHLLSGVKDWLFSQLAKTSIEVPKDFTLESVLKLVFKVLDITMEKMWKKLADRIGQPAVDKIRGAIDKLVGIWNFVKDVQQRGMAAIWEYIQGQISNLWDTVLGFVRDWIMKKIVDKVVTKLLSMLDPTGIMAVVNSFIAFFNAVQSAIEYFRQILEIIDSFVGTVAEIATGNVDRAAQFLENLLARSLPVAIGFLANQVGLGNVGEKIQEIIAGVREMVDKALDWLVDQAVKLGKAALNALGLSSNDEKDKDEVNFEVEEPAKMEQNSHTIQSDFKDGKLTLILRSNPINLEPTLGKILDVISSDHPDRELLEGFLKLVKDVEHNTENKINEIIKGKKLGNENVKEKIDALKEKYKKEQLAAIANALENLAKKAHITELDAFFKDFPAERYIPRGSQGEVGKFIRYNLYDKMFDWGSYSEDYKNRSDQKPALIKRIKNVQATGKQNEWDKLIDEGVVDKQPTMKSYNADEVDYELDHKTPVASLWNNEGWNAPEDDTRKTHFLNEGNLKVLTKKANSAKSSGGVEYKNFVGLNFKSSIADSNAEKAYNIAGESFWDAAKKPLK